MNKLMVKIDGNEKYLKEPEELWNTGKMEDLTITRVS